MVNDSLPTRPEWALAIAYSPRAARAGVTALLALDDRLASIVRRARDPMIGQMRLTWWFEALERLDRASPPAEPVLHVLAADVIPRGVTGTSLAAMIDGWEVLLSDDPLDDAGLGLFATMRGGTLFDAMAAIARAPDAQVAKAGQGWAMADLATNLADPSMAERARATATDILRGISGQAWSREGRGLGALALNARLDAEGGALPAARVARLLWHRVSGR